MEAINITAYTANSSQIEAIKAFMKALKIKFEVSKENESPYDPEFVAKIQKSRKQAEQCDVIRVEKKDLKKYLGL